jgi:hypothetical protein
MCHPEIRKWQGTVPETMSSRKIAEVQREVELLDFPAFAIDQTDHAMAVIPGGEGVINQWTWMLDDFVVDVFSRNERQSAVQ